MYSYSIFVQQMYWLQDKFSQSKEILKKEANIVKGARVCYCRIYHKFVNFIILNLFKVYYVALWSCDTVHKLMRQTTQKVNKHWHGRKGWEKESNTVKGAR